MKKAAISVSCLILLMSIILTGRIILNLLNKEEPGIADKTSSTNINVNLARPSDWKKVVRKAAIEERYMSRVDGSTATVPITAEILRQFYGYTDELIMQSYYVRHSTTHAAYEKLIYKRRKEDDMRTNDRVDLIFVTPPSAEELRLAENNGTELDIKPIANDAFVFITHKDNPVDSLTVEQIQKIYMGEITNWKEVGGENSTIKAYQREKNSGSQTAMEQMVMQGKEMTDPINTKVHMGMGALVEAVAEYQNGRASIGYTYYYYINNLYINENIKVLKVNGIAPENENLTNKKYVFSTNYCAVIRKDEPEDSPARILRDFLLTEEGQDLIEEAGYCRSELKI